MLPRGFWRGHRRMLGSRPSCASPPLSVPGQTMCFLCRGLRWRLFRAGLRSLSGLKTGSPPGAVSISRRPTLVSSTIPERFLPPPRCLSMGGSGVRGQFRPRCLHRSHRWPPSPTFPAAPSPPARFNSTIFPRSARPPPVLLLLPARVPGSPPRSVCRSLPSCCRAHPPLARACPRHGPPLFFLCLPRARWPRRPAPAHSAPSACRRPFISPAARGVP